MSDSIGTNATALYFATALCETLLQGFIVAQLFTYVSTTCKSITENVLVAPSGVQSTLIPEVRPDQCTGRDNSGWERDRWWGLQGYTIIVVLASVMETSFQILKSWTFVQDPSDWPRHPMRTTEVLANVIVTVLVQLFFIHRCWKTSRNLFVSTYLLLLLVGQSAINICMAVALRGDYGQEVYTDIAEEAEGHRKKITILNEPRILIPFYVVIPILLDASITTTLMAYFKKWRTGLPTHDALLRHISYMACEAAALPTVARLIAGIAWLAHANDVAMFFAMIPAKLYVIAYLRALNVRPDLRAQVHSVHGREVLDEEQDIMPWETAYNPWNLTRPVAFEPHPQALPQTHLVPGAATPRISPILATQHRIQRSNTLDSERDLTFIEALCVTQPGADHSVPHPILPILPTLLPLTSVSENELQLPHCESRRSSDATCVP